MMGVTDRGKRVVNVASTCQVVRGVGGLLENLGASFSLFAYLCGLNVDRETERQGEDEESMC